VLNDYSVCITAWVDGQHVYVLDVMRAKLEYYKVRQRAIDLARLHKAKVILIEDASSGQALISSLRHEEPPGVVLPTARRPAGDKVTRMSAASAMIERGQLMLPENAPWLAEFKNEVLGFPSVAKGDQVDALSQLLIWVDEQQAYQTAQLIGATVFYRNR
jgi:predicted phage terminase large subunit-like protein